jgi:hypothetical protein
VTVATGSTASSFKTVLGIAKEPQPAAGTPVASTNYIPVRKFDVSNKVDKLQDQGWRGSMVTAYGVQNGVQQASISVEGDAFADTVPWFLAGMLGDVQYSGGTSAGTPTTTTAILTAGTSTVIAVTAATGIVAGTVLLIDTSTLQEAVTVLSVASLNVTITAPVAKSHTTGVAVQPVTAPFTQTMALYNGGNGQPTSYTVTDSDALSTRQYTSTRWTDLTLSWDTSKLLTYSATGMSWATLSTTSAPTQSYSGLLPAASWMCQASYGGSVVGNVQTAELAFKRQNSECIFTLQNTQNPFEVHVGPLELTSKITLVATDETWLTDYLADTGKVLTLALTNGSGATATQITVRMTNHYATQVNKTKGKSYIEFDIAGLAVGNTTDIGLSAGYSPCLVTVQNGVAPATFA